MKRIIGLILAFMLIVTIIGCSKFGNISHEKITHNKIPSASSLVISSEDKFTHDDAIALFMADKEINDYEVFDSVLVDDDKLPLLKAVILFDDREANNSCNFAFIIENSDREILPQEITFAVNKVEGVKDYHSSRLTYKGNGAVTTSISEIETKEVFDVTVRYSYEESTSSTNFELISDKP